MARAGTNFIKQYIKNNSKRFDHVLDKLKIISAEDGKLKAELKIEEAHTDASGNLHSGFSATLIDTLSTYGKMTHVDSSGLAVSVDLHIKYKKQARIGEEIIVDTKTVYVKPLFHLEIAISNKKTGEVLVEGHQTLFPLSG